MATLTGKSIYKYYAHNSKAQILMSYDCKAVFLKSDTLKNK